MGRNHTFICGGAVMRILNKRIALHSGSSVRKLQQSGVALISALLVVAIATTAAVTLSASMQLNLRRSANLYTRDQAWQYLLGVEEFGKVLLKQAIDNDKLDLLIGEERALPVEGGVVTGRIIDLQAGININDIIDADDKENGVAIARIEKIYEAQGVEKQRVNALIDWLDENNDVKGATGAENNYYFGQDPAYRAANRLMESTSELYLLREMKPEDVTKLLTATVDGKPTKLLTTLPRKAQKKSGLTPVNINTAPEAVLSALGIANSEAILKNRPYSEVPSLSELGLGKKDDDKQKRESLAVSSNYFQLEATATIGRAKLRSFSIIELDGNKPMQVISRSFGTE